MNLTNENSSDFQLNQEFNTFNEIVGQPELWNSIFGEISLKKEEITGYLNKVIPNVKKIVLTGAGSSAFIGMSLQGIYFKNTGIHTIAIPTTDLISHPYYYLQSDEPTLIVSFARSGNSPESAATLRIADEILKHSYHLIITCDPKGELANYKSQSMRYVFLLPEAANDKGLAMTGSYTGMLLAGLLFSDFLNISNYRKQVELVCSYGKKILGEYMSALKEMAQIDFKRAVFLGSGSLLGTATESHLKLQELSDGQIICKNDSFLGFRHGPKAVVNEETLVVYFLSNNRYVAQYESDLIRDMNRGKSPMYQVSISERPLNNLGLDQQFVLSDADQQIEEEFLTLCNVIIGQLLGFFKSIELGLNPDSPSVSGAINRVVQGVKIYSI